jgi:hypothetical protein
MVHNNDAHSLPFFLTAAHSSHTLMTRAAAPATCGDAMLVPEMVLVAVSLVYHADVVPTPGANRSTQEP